MTYINKQSAELAQAGLHDKLLLPGVRAPALSGLLVHFSPSSSDDQTTAGEAGWL